MGEKRDTAMGEKTDDNSEKGMEFRHVWVFLSTQVHSNMELVKCGLRREAAAALLSHGRF